MLLDNVTFLFNHARKRESTKIKHLENRHPIIIHLNCQEKHPFILATYEQTSPVKTCFLIILKKNQPQFNYNSMPHRQKNTNIFKCLRKVTPVFSPKNLVFPCPPWPEKVRIKFPRRLVRWFARQQQIEVRWYCYLYHPNLSLKVKMERVRRSY